MYILPIKTRIFQESENLEKFVLYYLKYFSENSILVITSKIIALSEGRTLPRPKTKRQKASIIKSESEWALKTRHVWLTKKDGQIMASAGIDESNANGKIILLPKDSYKTAKRIRSILIKKFKLKNCGVLVTDSRTQPLRAGVTGTAVGYAGFKGLRTYTNTKDIFGRKFKYSRTNIVDCLASAAILVMGEGKEQQPMALIQDAPIEFIPKISKNEVLINLADDIYLPLLQNIS
jgi:dihydrofolate synthase / folylpolyglutamate synthase